MSLDPELAGILVRIARKSRSVPELACSCANGEVSVSNARVIASVITPQNQDAWLEKAKTLPKAKLEREVAKISPTGCEARKKFDTLAMDRVQYIVTLDLSLEEYERRENIKNLVSQSIRKSANDSEVEVAMIKCLCSFTKIQMKKAERAANRKTVKLGTRPRSGPSTKTTSPHPSDTK